MTEKINSTLRHKNSKSSDQKKKKNLISHPLIFDKENIDKLEETLKTLESHDNSEVSPSEKSQGKNNN